MGDEYLYRVAIRNDRKGEIVYYRGTLSNVLKRILRRQSNGVLELDGDDKVYITPATHRMPWEIPPEERTDNNLLTKEDT